MKKKITSHFLFLPIFSFLFFGRELGGRASGELKAGARSIKQKTVALPNIKKGEKEKGSKNKRNWRYQKISFLLYMCVIFAGPAPPSAPYPFPPPPHLFSFQKSFPPFSRLWVWHQKITKKKVPFFTFFVHFIFLQVFAHVAWRRNPHEPGAFFFFSSFFSSRSPRVCAGAGQMGQMSSGSICAPKFLVCVCMWRWRPAFSGVFGLGGDGLGVLGDFLYLAARNPPSGQL